MLNGSCLCGRVRYEVAGELSDVEYCHCSQCRKSSGSAFAVNGAVSSAEFRFVVGAASVTEYESSPGVFRCFCRHCGSPLIKRMARRPETVGLRLGTLDTDPGARPERHIHVASKAPWVEIADDLPQDPGD